MTQNLPSNEQILSIADILHNFLPNRRYDTIAVGAVGRSPFAVDFVVGINSSSYSEGNITLDRIMPPIIRNNPIITDLKLIVTREPYHAEVSVMLSAKDTCSKVYAIGSSRKICHLCSDFFVRHQDALDPDCYPVDSWEINGILLSQEKRKEIESMDWYIQHFARAIRAS